MDRRDATVRPIYPSEKASSFITEEGKRVDGRTLEQFRKIFMRTGMVKAARGSAYLEINNTKLLCAVYGPRLSKDEFSEKGRINCDFKMASFATKQRRSKQSKRAEIEQENREYSILMRDALEVSVALDKFPKSVIDIYCLVLEADGGVLGAAITAASLALADAGVEMYDTVASCSASEIQGQIVVDPTNVEERYSTGGVVVALMPSLNEITQLSQTGDMSSAKVSEAIEICVDGCKKLNELMKDCLLQSKQQQQQPQQAAIST